MVGPKLIGGDQGRYLKWVHGGGFPLTKKCFDAGDGF